MTTGSWIAERRLRWERRLDRLAEYLARAARQRDRQGAHDHQQIERPEENK
jgi:hypothetical protein